MRLRADREHAVRKGHPWVFSGAIRSDTGADDAAIARVESDRGEFLGIGFYSRESQIRVRLLEGETAWRGVEFFTERVAGALRLRRRVIASDTTGYRLINAEGDGVPGWTVDRFGDVLVSQITSAGLEKMRDAAYAALGKLLPECSVVQSNDLPSRRLEGLGLEDRDVAGQPPSVADFTEHGLLLEADLASGQKTGYYCDQRENRLLASRVAPGARVLDLFTHSGGFALHAARGGASGVVAVDSSAAALDRLDVHARLNRLTGIEARRADVFDFLRQAQGEFDVVICDPPPLARRRADVERAARAYKDVNRLAMKRLAPGGQLFTFTCSGAVDATLFRQILVSAAHEAGIALSWLKPLAAGPDHPIAASHPEGEYLKGWWCVRR